MKNHSIQLTDIKYKIQTQENLNNQDVLNSKIFSQEKYEISNKSKYYRDDSSINKKCILYFNFLVKFFKKNTKKYKIHSLEVKRKCIKMVILI